MFNRKSSNRRGIRESQKGIKMPKNGLVEGVGAAAKIDDSFKDETNDKLSKLENDYFNFKGRGYLFPVKTSQFGYFRSKQETSLARWL